MLGLAGVPSVILFFGFLFLPETPRWLLTKNRYDEARRALSKIRGKADVSRELSRLQNKLKKDEQQEKNSSFWDNIKDIARKPHIRRAVIVGCGLQAIQQLSGINTVMYYNVNIIQMAGVSDDEEAIWFGALVATGNFAFTIIGLFLVERIGRRKLLLGSLFGVFLSLGFLSAGFWVAKENSPYDFIYRDRKINGKECIYPKCDGCILNQDCGFCYATVNGSIKGTCQHILNGLQFKSWTSHDDHDCRIPILIPLNQSSFHYSNSTQFGYSNETNWANSYCPFSKAWIIIVALVFYLAWFAPGMGPMPWTVNSEIYPNRFRSTGQSLATAVNWIFNLAVSLTFLTLSNTETLGRHGAFLIYAGFALLGWIFIYATVPETKGLKLEQVVKLYKTPFRPACCGKSVAYEALDGKLSGTDLEVDEDLP
jgi:SP family myo-inositol transporter-like MFS transporter 13